MHETITLFFSTIIGDVPLLYRCVIAAIAMNTLSAPAFSEAIDRPANAATAGKFVKSGHSRTGVQPKIKKEKSSKGLGNRCPDGDVSADVVKSMIVKEATRQQADSKLALAIAEQESGFGSRLNSPAGARGIMQLMPATARQYGVNDICDAQENIRGGVSFIKDLSASLDGNVMLVVAAYNAGEGRIRQSKGVPAFAETVNYTARVINAYYDFKNVLSDNRSTRSTTIGGGAKAFMVQRVNANEIEPINSQVAEDDSERKWIGGMVMHVKPKGKTR